MGRRIRVLIVDNHPIYRAGMADMLKTRAPHIEVVGATGDGQEAIELARALRPDIVVTDIRLRGQDGIEVTKQVRAECPGASVLVLSAYDDDDLVFDAVRAGATGYLVKDARRSEIIAAIETIYQGGTVLSPTIGRKMLDQFALLARQGGGYSGSVDGLTPRQLDVLRLIAVGATNREVAAKLAVGERTVEKHVAHIYEKLGISSRNQAMAFALKRGLISLAEIQPDA